MAQKESTPKKTETLTLRLDPRMKFAIELLAREQKRTLAGVIEWAVTKAIAEYQINDRTSLGDMLNEIWSTDEVIRTTRLVTKFPQAATYDEMRIWDTIRISPDLWDGNVLDEAALHLHWRELLAHVEFAKGWTRAEPFYVPGVESGPEDGEDSGLGDAMDHIAGKS